MHTPPRILRADIDKIPGARPSLNYREQERREVILAAGRRVLAKHGRGGVRLSDLATALGMMPATIRRYFPDMDDLLAEILRMHMLAISTVIGDALRGAPQGAAQRHPIARAAYLAATRTVLGGPSEAHLLLIRERHHLPPDLRDCIEQTRDGLGLILAGEHGTEALGLLDMPELSAAMIKGMLRVLSPPARTTPRLQIVSRDEPPARRVKVTTGGLGAWAESAGACVGPPKAPSTQPYSTAGP